MIVPRYAIIRPISIKKFDLIKQEAPEIDDSLARHIARLFTRDPVPSYEGEYMEDQIDDNHITSHFENLQSTNWNSMRFKPPPSHES